MITRKTVEFCQIVIEKFLIVFILVKTKNKLFLNENFQCQSGKPEIQTQ